MPFIKDKFPKYQDFANASLIDIYGAEKIDSALHFTAKTFEHLVLMNNGPSDFSKLPLPNEAQISPVLTQILYDFNKDGILDLLIGGNVFDTEVETPAYDSGKGLYLTGTGDGNFVAHPDIRTTGIDISENVKEMRFIKVGRKQWPGFIVANNNDALNLLVYSK